MRSTIAEETVLCPESGQASAEVGQGTFLPWQRRRFSRHIGLQRYGRMHHLKCRHRQDVIRRDCISGRWSAQLEGGIAELHIRACCSIVSTLHSLAKADGHDGEGWVFKGKLPLPIKFKLEIAHHLGPDDDVCSESVESH